MREGVVLCVVLYTVLLCSVVSADFVYRNFNDTTGLVFVGDSATSSCDNDPQFDYQPRHGTADDLDNGTIPILQTENTVHYEVQSQATNDHLTSDSIATETALAGHRDEFVASDDVLGRPCELVARLTASQPAQRGALWRLNPAPLLGGFQTVFRFQVSDQSRSCTEVKDRHFSTFHHKSCMVHGGDGLAFVVQRDPALTSALGGGGDGVGYANLTNALAIEFDTWFNPEEGDLFEDHVSVQLAGPGDFLTPGEHHRLSRVRAHNLAEGKIHTVKITYDKFLNYDLLDTITASPALLPFLKDNGEGRRIGTFAVYVDNMTVPLIVFPINLSLALDLPEGDAVVGFTSSTGRAWEKHDIKYWVWCDLNGCPLTPLDSDQNVVEDFDPNLDYHQTSILNFRR